MQDRMTKVAVDAATAAGAVARLGRQSSKRARGLCVHAAAGAVALTLLAPLARATSDTWVGAAGANWLTSSNWSTTPATVPGTGDTATFNNATAGASQTISLGVGVTINTILFDTANAAAYAIGSGAAGSQALTLNNAGAITMNAAVAANETINSAVLLGTDATASSYTFANNSTTNALSFGGTIAGGTGGTAAGKTLTFTGAGNFTEGGVIANGGATALALTKTGTGTLTMSGGPSTYTGATTITAGTIKLGASGALPAGTAVALGNSGTATLDLTGLTQTIGNLTVSTNTAGSAGTITSSALGGALTINTSQTGNVFGQTLFTGSLALTLNGTNLSAGTGNNAQVLNTGNTFSGGLTLKSSNAQSLSTSNLATAGGLTGQQTEGLRTNVAAAVGTGAINLDNGQLFIIANINVANTVNVSSRGGVLHMEGTGTPVNNPTTGYTGAINNSGGLLVMNSNSGNTNIVPLSGSLAGFAGTMALDTTNIGGVAFSGSALGNSNMNLLWFGNGTNGGQGRVRWNGTGDTTLTFGELSNLNSGAVGSTMSGVLENGVAASTVTYSIGNSTTDSTTFQGVIRNGTGTTALTKNGTNTQTLAGASTYTGNTNVNGGVLNITGSLAAGTASTVNSGGTLAAGTGGTINGPVTVNGGGKLLARSGGTIAGAVTVNGGGSLGGTGTISGLVTLASDPTPANQGAINLVDSAVGTLTLGNAAGLTLGGAAAGSASQLNFEANSLAADTVSLGANPLTINAGGANLTIASLGVSANQTYNLITFGSGTFNGSPLTPGSGTSVDGLTLTNPSIVFGVSGTLNVTPTAVQLVTTGSSAPATAYWSGANGTQWSSTDAGNTQGNFTTDAGGMTFAAAYPGANTDVIFSASNATNFLQTLGQNFDVKSVTFSGSSPVTINGDGNQLTIESGGLSVQSGAGAVAIGANIAGPGGVTTAAGLTLSGNNTYTGGTTVNAGGTLKLGSTTALGAASGALTMNGGVLDVNGTAATAGPLAGSAGAIITNNSATANATLTTTTAGSTTYAGVLADGANGKTLGLSVTGSGSLTLSGSNSYSGTTTVSGGTLIVANDAALGTSGLSLPTSGGVVNFNTAAPSVGALSGITGSSVVLGNTTSHTATALTVGGNNASTAFGGLISDGTSGDPAAVGSLIKTGPGALTLSGANTFTGGTTIKAGTIVQTVAGALGGGSITLGDGASGAAATLQGTTTATVTNANPIVIAAGGSGVYTIKNTSGSDYNFSGPIALNNAATFTTTGNGAIFLSGAITGSGDVTISGGGTTTKFVGLTADNSTTFTGNVLVRDNGDLKTRTNALSAANTVTLDSTGTLDNGAQNLTIAGLNDGPAGAGANSRSVILAGAGTTLTLGGSGSYSYSGAVVNSGGLAMNGTGTQVLAGTGTYTGNTTVNAGTLTLAATGSLASPNLNATGGTLNLNGAVASTAAINANGGTINFAGNAGTGASARTVGAVAVGTGGLVKINASAFPATPAVLTASGLSFTDATSKLDLTNNEVIVSATALAAVTPSIAGQNIITSSSGGGVGSLQVGPDVELRFTLLGDTNLDGHVDVTDLGNLASSYGASSGATWVQGDTNYDGAVDVTDLGNLASSYGGSLASGPSAGAGGMVAASLASVAGAGAGAAVPEPTSLGLIAMGAMGLLARRRRR